MSDAPRGKGIFGWLGRQVGHIKKAIQTDVSPEKVAYRNHKVEEAAHPDQPNVKLRRTTIDEVIVKNQLPSMHDAQKANEADRGG